MPILPTLLVIRNLKDEVFRSTTKAPNTEITFTISFPVDRNIVQWVIKILPETDPTGRIVKDQSVLKFSLLWL